MENKFGDNLKWFLEEAACADQDTLEDGEIDIYGETTLGVEGAVTVKLSELCESALVRIQELESGRI